jgi:hypothetical protein
MKHSTCSCFCFHTVLTCHIICRQILVFIMLKHGFSHTLTYFIFHQDIETWCQVKFDVILFSCNYCKLDLCCVHVGFSKA